MRKTTRAPMYQTVASHLRSGIKSGQWQPGDLLPSEAALCNEFKISRGTVVRALEVLITEGLASRRQGVGTFVTRPALHRMPGFLSSFTETVREQGRRTWQRLISEKELSRVEALEFGCGEPALLLCRERYVDDVAWALHHSVIPLSVAEQIPALHGPDRKTKDQAFSLYRCFTEAGITIDHAEETLSVRLASAEEADRLSIRRPAAVMVIHRKSFDDTERLLESVEAIYQSGKYTYEARLVRTHDATALPSGSRLQSIRPFPDSPTRNFLARGQTT